MKVVIDISIFTREAGAFGNADHWIDGALLRAFRLVKERDLDVAIVSYGPPLRSLRDLVQASGFAAAG